MKFYLKHQVPSPSLSNTDLHEVITKLELAFSIGYMLQCSWSNWYFSKYESTANVWCYTIFSWQ